MTKTKFPLDLLASFVSVAQFSSITAAARALNMSKATVSKQITELEGRLGIILFARTTRRLSLTDAGHAAFERARRIIDEAEALAEDALETQTAPRGLLRIAGPATFGQMWLTPILPAFLKAYPDISLELHLDDRPIDLIASGYDATLRIGTMPDSSLVARQLATIGLHLVASPAYWLRHQMPTHPDDLSSHACVRYLNAPDGPIWRFKGPAGELVKVRVDGPLAVNAGDAALPALCAGLGVALLPDFIICQEVRAGRLQVAMTDWQSPSLTLHLLTPPGRGKPKRLGVFTDFVAKHLGARPPPWALS
jgi:DNA-binding transcriptional LysR family regulator